MAQYTVEQLLAAAERARADNNDIAARNLEAMAAAVGQRPAIAAEGIADSGVARQGLAGLYEGAASVLGAPVDIISGGMGLLGLRDENAPAPVGGSESIKGLIQALSGGQGIVSDEPSTRLERIVRRTGETVGGSLPVAGAVAAIPRAVSAAPSIVGAARTALGEMGATARAAPLAYAGTEAAIAAGAGAASGVVKEAFPESATADMIAQFVGGAFGAGAASAARRAIASVTPMIKPAPQVDPVTNRPIPVRENELQAVDLENAASRMYDNMRADAVTPIGGRKIDDVVNWASEYAKTQGLVDREGAPREGGSRFVKFLTELNTQYNPKPTWPGGPMTMPFTPQELLAFRRSIADAATDARAERPAEALHLRNLLRRLDAATSEMAPEIAAANSMYSRAMKTYDVEDMMALAEVNASRAGGYENALRTQFQQLARRIIRGKEPGWSMSEIEQINQIAEGGTAQNMARFIGRFQPKGAVSAIPSGGVASMVLSQTSDPYLAAAAGGTVAGVGALGNVAARRLQALAVDDMMKSILQGRNINAEGERRLRAAVTAYIASQMAAQGQDYLTPDQQ